tara:strand:+ start:28577 stop:28936 length:360 start_codon:yes stop_codon:yes gene_type:complete
MNQGNNLLTVILGTAVGVGVGMLFAPDKGSVTRKKIADNANSAKDTLLTEAEKMKANIASKTSEIRDNVADSLATGKGTLDSQLDIIVTNASYKADDVISSLERRLKELKAKNKTLQTK